MSSFVATNRDSLGGGGLRRPHSVHNRASSTLHKYVNSYKFLDFVVSLRGSRGGGRALTLITRKPPRDNPSSDSSVTLT